MLPTISITVQRIVMVTIQPLSPNPFLDRPGTIGEPW
jgi:hypothetical protein